MHYTFIDIITATVLAFINLGIGLSISFIDYKKVLTTPKALLLGLSAQMIGMPILAFIIATFSSLSPEFKVGIILLALSPGGTTSNFVTYQLKGNTALSISMTSVNSFLNLISIPLLGNLALFYFMGQNQTINLPLGETILQIFLITILPATIGLLINEGLPIFSKKIKKPTKVITIILLAVVFSVKLFAKEEDGGSGITLAEILEVLPYGLLLNIIGILFGFWVASNRWFGNLINKNAYTIGIEVGLQNTTMAFLIAGTLLQNQAMTKPSLTYSLFSFWMTIIFAFILMKDKKKFLRSFLNSI